MAKPKINSDQFRFLQNSRELHIHLQGWDAGQAGLCKVLLAVAPYLKSVEDFTTLVEGLQVDAEIRANQPLPEDLK